MKALPADDQKKLVNLAQTGDRMAEDLLVRSSFGLVRQISVYFARTNPGYEADDLFQEGCLALMEAIKYFDTTRGWNFDTYAADCVRRRLARHLTILSQAPIQSGDDDTLHAIPSRESEDYSPSPTFRKIQEMIDALPPIEQDILRKRVSQEVATGWSETSLATGVPEDDAQRLYDRIVQEIAKLSNRKPPYG